MPAFTDATKLHRAVMRGDWDEASYLVAQGVEPAKRTVKSAERYEGNLWRDLLSVPRSPCAKIEERLYADVLCGDFKGAESLITRGVVPDEKMLAVAVQYLDMTWMKLLAEASPKEALSAAVLEALRWNDRKVPVLLEAGAVPDEDAMCYVAVWEKPGLTKKMLAAGGPATPRVLARAMKYPELDTVKALLKAGAVPDEETVISVIGERRDSGWVRMLLDARAAAGVEPTPEMLDAVVRSRNRGGSALLMADDLIERGVVPDDSTFAYAARGDDGWAEMMLEAMIDAGRELTPDMLHAAVENNRESLAQDLIARGVVPHDFTIEQACAFRSPVWVEILLRPYTAAGHKPTYSMLETAVVSADPFSVFPLIDHGAEPDTDLLVHMDLKLGRHFVDAVFEKMKARIEKEKAAANDDKKTPSESYNQAAAKAAKPKLVQGTAFRPTPRLVRSASLKGL